MSVSGAQLFAVADIPEFAPFFKSFDHFNPIQTALLPSLLSEDERNIVCTAPTASGKTVLLEIALLKFFLPHPTGRKAIYVAPLKSLVSEKFEQWSAQFPQLRLCEVTGDCADSDALGIRNLTTHDLLLTTPEKLDSIMRRWREHHSLTDQIGLLLVDEIHCLGEARGGTLEGLISRCKAMRELQRAQNSRLPIASLRIVAVSATFANAADLGEWLDADCHIFGDEYRPVPITTMVVGYPPSKNDFIFQQNLDYRLLDLIRQYSEGKPTLIFCATRKGACTTAKHVLIRSAGMFVRDASHAVVLQAAAQLISDRPLAECVRAGIAFHSAGLVHADRQCVENLFRDGHLYVVSATSTLGMGVNLPAKLVIVKGTSFYEHARGFVPMPRSQVTQLIGRAGRPQFDTSGVALILTEHGSVDFYKRMLLNADEVESHLGESLPEFVCTEVVQKTISDAGEAIHWMNSTFLALRMKKAPHRYRSSSIAASATAAASSSSSVASGSPEKLVLDCVDGLVQKGLLKYSEDGSVSALIGAELLTRYYLRVETVCHLLESANRAVSLEDAFRVLIEAAEFGDFPIRMGEKGLLNDLAKSAATRFPLGAKKVASTADKVSVLLQAMLQSHAIDNWQLKQDGAQCLLLARRVSSAILTLALENTDVVKAPALLAAVRLSQAMRACMWHDSERPLQQLDGVGPQIAWNLSVGKITTLRELNDASVVAIAHASQKSAAWASSLKQATRAFPLLKVQAQLSGSGQAVKILLEQEREEYATPTFPHFAVIVVHVDAVLLLRKRIRLLSGAQSYQFSLKLDAHTTFACDSLSIVAAVDSLAGADAHAKLRLPAERVVLATTPVAAPAASLPAGTVQRSFASKRKSPAGDASGSGGGGSSSSGSGGGDMVSSLREQGRAAGLPSLSKRACVAPNSSLLSNWSAQSATEPFKYKIDMFRLAGDSHPSDSNSSSTSGGNKDIAAAARPTRTPVAEINALSRSEDENSFLSSQNELESRAESSSFKNEAPPEQTQSLSTASVFSTMFDDLF